jgi:hypothetical protein
VPSVSTIRLMSSRDFTSKPLIGDLCSVSGTTGVSIAVQGTEGGHFVPLSG